LTETIPEIIFEKPFFRVNAAIRPYGSTKKLWSYFSDQLFATALFCLFNLTMSESEEKCHL